MTSYPRYHLRRADRAVDDPAELDRILRTGRFMTVAFARGDEPYLVSLSYGYEPGAGSGPEGGRLFCHAAHEGLKSEFMRANPEVCATVVVDGGYNAGACEHPFESVVLRGTLAEVEDADERRHGMRVLLGHLESPEDSPVLWEKHRLDQDAVYGRMAVLRMDIAEITGKSGS